MAQQNTQHESGWYVALVHGEAECVQILAAEDSEDGQAWIFGRDIEEVWPGEHDRITIIRRIPDAVMKPHMAFLAPSSDTRLEQLIERSISNAPLSAAEISELDRLTRDELSSSRPFVSEPLPPREVRRVRVRGCSWSSLRTRGS